ncbi:MAG TPA: succinate dehydrogenase/fumarate reductase iron-sulfur subunit [Acidimicrobiales bacterium]|nr:succinate dehydrogenase/fumarate reductase iron-sulfur subunit [Acidimicrobiales bacterium]
MTVIENPLSSGRDSTPQSEGTINLKLKVWRQAGPSAEGRMVDIDAPGISTDMSFLEMLDVVNERLIKAGDEPIAFEHDCREGICGSCGMMVNGIAHGPQRATTVCQLHMRHFRDGETLWIEPWRAQPFPVIRDLVVDRSAFDKIIQAGGYITAPTGHAPEANNLPVAKADADTAFEAANCIGCGACVAACPNASAMLFTSAKISHLGHLPQGQPERDARVMSMLATQDSLGFGSCTNIGECSAACPKEIPMESIARMNKDLLRATRRRKRRPGE